jgi:acetyltransferase-like isoleucine patch superfamily enzyme
MKIKKFPLNKSVIPVGIEKPIRFLLKKIAIRNNVSIGFSARISRGVVVSAPNQMIIGNNVSIGPNSLILVDGSIGSYSLLSFGVLLVGRNDHKYKAAGELISLSSWGGRENLNDSEKIHLGKDVWIGAGAIIVGPATIGNGSIIGAGSVVVSDIPECSIFAGNPARFIGNRFDSELEKSIHLEFLKKIN